MDITRFIIFFSILTTIFISLEFYTLFNWRKYIIRNKIHKKYYIVPNVISIILLSASTISMFSSLFLDINHSFRFITMFLIAIWVLPKLAIVPILLLKDASRLFIKIIQKFNKESKVNIDKNRRKILETSAWTLAAIPFYMVTKGLFSTTYDFTVRKAEIKLNKLNKNLNGLRIVQISDLHLGSFFDGKPFQEVLRIVNNLKPDIIFITGDFVNSKPSELRQNYNDIKSLNADIGIFSCLGNHDHYMSDSDHKVLLNVLNDLEVNLFNNRNQKLVINNSNLNIVGVDNVGMRQKFGDFDKAFEGVDSDIATILLCHDPTNWDKNIRNKYNADLTLSGHTHGGQVAWEFNGFELKPAKFVYRQSEGLYKNGNSQLYVNRGIGTVGPPLRIGVKPEITEITLKS